MPSTNNEDGPVPGALIPVDGAESRAPVGLPRLTLFLPWLFRLSVGFGLAEAALGAVLGEQALTMAAALTGGFAGTVLAARWLTGRGQVLAATWLVADSICLIAFLGTLTVPGVGEAMAMLPVLAIALLLPHSRGRNRRWIVALAIGATVMIFLGATLGHPAPMAQPAGDVFANAILVAVVGLVVAALVDFWNNASHSQLALASAVTEQHVQSAERVAVGHLLEALGPKETVEATAQAIAAALVTLPGIHVGVVLEYWDAGLRVLGAAGPAEFAFKIGGQIEAVEARGLISSSSNGPWAQPATAGPGAGDGQDAGPRTNLQALVYAPMRSGGELVGLIGIGTSDPRVAEHLVADLPVVAAVAATATALLAPALLARRQVADARGVVERIIAEQAFAPVFQMITSLPDRQVVAYEALTRFTDGIRPDRHFAEATAVGLGVELELVTLAVAVRAAEGLSHSLWLTLNVSPAAIEASGRLSQILRRSDHPLVLELTEHVAVADYTKLRRALKDLRVPFRIAVDDAGAGYASMTHVVELEPALIKLDISLVRGIDTDPVRQALVAGILFFSQRIGCRLIAEGIETEAELAMLASMGVPLGQGFLLGRPEASPDRPKLVLADRPGPGKPRGEDLVRQPRHSTRA